MTTPLASAATRHPALALLFAQTLLLAGCGGGGGAAPAPAPSATTLSASASTLALSVNGGTAALTGTPRTLTLTNTGSAAAQSVGYTASPALPAGTTVSSTCGSSLAAGASCTLTITPGSTPSAAAGDTNPSAVTLSVSGSNTNTLTAAVHVLAYGSVYQAGYVFAIDDTTPATGSIGGKAAALSDHSSAVEWGGLWTVVGVDETATSPCDAKSDGACNTQQIVATLGSGTYGAKICDDFTSGSYTDWYLPAICEMSYDATSMGTGCGSAGTPLQQNMQSNLVETGVLPIVGLFYLSSTEHGSSPNVLGWMHLFDSGGGQVSQQVQKDTVLYTRCVRALTQ